MTELEKLERAKMYIDNLANGIDPITGKAMEFDTVLNNVRLARCFFYVSGILNEVINNNGQIVKSQKKEDFIITQKQLDSVIVSENPIKISELCRKIDSVIASPNMKKLQATIVTSWLLKKEILYIETDSLGKQRKSPTHVGEQLGITVEKRSGYKGDYLVNLYNKEAQQFIIDNLLQILKEDNK